eukprot:gene20639-22674_t
MMLRATGNYLIVLLLYVACSFASREYEIVHPVRLDNHRERRDLSTRLDDVLHEESALFGIKTSKGQMNLAVKRSKGFHTNKILLSTFDDTGARQSTQHQPDSCFYHGKVENAQESDVVLNTCNGLRGHIDDGEKAYQIEPIKGRESDGAHKFFEAPKPPSGVTKGISFNNDYVDTEMNDDTDDNSHDDIQLPNNSTEHYAKLSLIPGVEKQYIKYLTTNKTRYCEMFLVVDNAVYREYGNDTKVVTDRMLYLVHSVDRSYAAINIRIVLVALEIWTDKNKIDYYESGGSQLGAFNTYRRNNLLNLVDHDIAHYMSKRSWSGGVIGMAYLNVVCSRNIGSAINIWSFHDIRGSAGVVGHELGHNFDFPHDSDMVNCTCLTSRGCFMGGSKTRRNGFTDCNLRRLARRAFTCINNYPESPMGQMCGNGIKEGDEECDCGNAETCKRNDPCCQPDACKLKPSSQCSDANGQDCCQNCLFKKQGTLCREASSSCDVAEYCTGDKATCPADLTVKDGTTCSNHATIISGSSSDNSEKTVKLNPRIKARYLRFNPVYKPGKYYCLRLEILACTANEVNRAELTPISTPDLYYTSALCFKPASANCSESMSTDPKLIFKKQRYGDCNKPNMLYRLENDGTLRHNCSGKIVCPDSSDNLYLKKECPNGRGQYERLANFGLRHKATGKCVEQYNGWPGWPDGGYTKLRGTANCEGGSHRTKLHFFEQECILPIGMENGQLPNSAFKSSYKIHRYYEAHEARLQSGKGWCIQASAGKNEYLQVDMGQLKTVSGFKMQGATGDWVTGLRLFYSDDAVNWKPYQSYSDPDNSSKAFCYSGKCGDTLGTQCKDLWDPEAVSAHMNCWNKLNTEAAGFGTCDASSNKTCALKDVYCGQIQCSSKKNAPTHIKYGRGYQKVNASGELCSAASITTLSGSSSDEGGLGMVADGTKCGDNKICYNQMCQRFSELNFKECGTSNNLVCAGRGVCDNKGNCHCNGGYDPNTNCSKSLLPTHGNWGNWREWSACTAACNGGTRHRSRFCDTPFPAHGGRDCVGQRIAKEACNTQACPSGRSCKDVMLKLRADGFKPVDGVYMIKIGSKQMPAYCDMTNDGGGWTLVVSSHTNDWASSDMVKQRNIDKPELLKDYSMLAYADSIKDSYLIADNTFEFKLEAQDRGRWGGIWQAPSSYRINSNSSSQTDIVLKKKFDGWVYGRYGLQSRLPFILGNRLTTNTQSSWGSITDNAASYHPSRWIYGKMMESEPEHIWYWMREGSMKLPTSCMEIKHRGFSISQVAQSGVYSMQDGKGKKISAYCDMQSFGGGWTLLVNKISGAGWTKTTLLSRNSNQASKSDEYSILYHAKAIMEMRREESTFQYMIEADGQQQWGGIFEGSIKDGLTSCTPSPTKPKLLKKFSNWNESTSDLLKTNPYVVDNLGSLLTVSLAPTLDGAGGALVSQSKSIYITKLKETPSFVRLWIRESASFKSCNQLKTAGQRLGANVNKNGYYNIRGQQPASIKTVYCDMESDAGAWTLLVTSVNGGWTMDQVKSRNEDRPSILHDYSILHMADGIKGMSNNDTFRYKLDGFKFNRWGGIWSAPISYTFVSKSALQEKVSLITQFDKWSYNVWYRSVCNRMPWLGAKKGILTTSGTSDYAWWGTIIADNKEYNPAPWISGEMSNPGVIWYWVNEDDCSADRKPVDGGFTPWSMWTKCSSFCGQGTQSRSRQCTAPKPRCGGAVCHGVTKQMQKCSGSCEESPIKSYDSLYCVLPQSGGCNASDDTFLVWRKGINNCDLPEAQFTFDKSSGSITHKCSGKPVCPQGGSNGWSKPILVSSKCPAMKLTRNFIRTHVGSVNFGGKCLHPSGGSINDNVALVLWSGCFTNKVFQNFFKLARGPVHTKFWNSVKVAKWDMSDLTSDVRFPGNPTSKGRLDNFDSPYDLDGNYGLQMVSYFVAPETGMYTFEMACDDFCQLFLSNSSASKDKVKIVDVRGWTSQYQYNRRSDQKSQPIPLVGGKKYYIEGLLVEAGGGDHISVAVTFPSGSKSIPLDGYYLRDNAD